MSTRSSSEYSQSPRADIQHWGFLLALDPEWRVTNVSANFADHFSDCGQGLAGRPLSEIFGASAVHALRNRLALLRDQHETARLFSLALAGAPKPFDIAMSRMGDNILIEAFPAAPDAGDPIGTVRALAALLDRHSDLAQLLREGARQLRALTGFERVTIFRFADDGQAEQMAHEERGKHPAPSPPAYSNGLRMIGDVDSGLVAVDPPPGDELLSACLLRAPSEPEIAQTKANAAFASLTLPLRSGGRDWGVTLCLNSSPRRPMLDRIAAAELFADLLAMRAELCALRG